MSQSNLSAIEKVALRIALTPPSNRSGHAKAYVKWDDIEDLRKLLLDLGCDIVACVEIEETAHKAAMRQRRKEWAAEMERRRALNPS